MLPVTFAHAQKENSLAYHSRPTGVCPQQSLQASTFPQAFPPIKLP